MFPHYSAFKLTSLFRIKQKLRTGELSVSGDHWPIFLFSCYQYDDDDPWKGLLRSMLLVKVTDSSPFSHFCYDH